MSLEQLIFEKNMSAEPRGAAWNAFLARGGPNIVPSNQTCFEGGIGSNPRVSERCAGRVFPDVKLPFPCVNCKPDCSEEANYCWQNPCNVVLPREKKCDCDGDGKKSCRKRRHLYLVR